MRKGLGCYVEIKKVDWGLLCGYLTTGYVFGVFFGLIRVCFSILRTFVPFYNITWIHDDYSEVSNYLWGVHFPQGILCTKRVEVKCKKISKDK